MTSLLRFSFVPLLFAAACATDSSSVDPDDEQPPACTPVDDQVLASDATLLDAIIVDGKPIALVRTSTGAAIIDGEVITPIAVAAKEGTLARDGHGTLVAVLHDDTARKSYAATAPDFAPVDAGIDEMSKPHLAAWNRVCTTGAGCVTIDALTLFYKDRFSSATAAHRNGAAWDVEELYMSSVSWIEDTADMDGDVIACARYTSSAVLLGHHPYRGDLDDLTGWPASGNGCAITARGRDVTLVLGSSPPRLARWTVPYMPQAPWPDAPDAVDLPLTTEGLYDLADEDGTLVLAYVDTASTLHLATESGGTWTEQAAPALRTYRAPILKSDAKARHLLVSTDDGLHYTRTCR